jgi:dipeptidyl aminopeptidase/acylaminoacyl peptidase
MVRHVVSSKRMAGSAVLAIAVGGAALLWHLLACIESPMAYSPDGQDLAFVTMQPYDAEDDALLAGRRVYRLMVLHGEKELRTLEETTAAMLSAPGFSPDGKRLAYLRIPLLSKSALERFKKDIERRKGLLNSLAPTVWPEALQQGGLASAPSSAPAAIETDIGLPSMQAVRGLWEKVHACPAVPAQLVVRAVQDGALVSATALQLPGLCEEDAVITYVTTRPQYGPDGHWVYLTAGDSVFRVNPATSQVELVVAPAAVATLSPDGKVLAVFQEGALGFVQTDGHASLYKPAGELRSPAALAWTAEATLAVMEAAESGSGIVLHFLDKSGKTLKSVHVELPARQQRAPNLAAANASEGMLAISPDGGHAVVAYENDVYFISSEGNLLKTWSSEDDVLAQPTFSPDGQRVAFKSLSKEAQGVTAIVFFTPEGREVTRVPIPPINPAATQASPP